MPSFNYGRLRQYDASADAIEPVPLTHLLPKKSLLPFISTAILGFLLGIASTILMLSLAEHSEGKSALWSSSLATQLGTKWVKFQGGLFEQNPYRGRPSKNIDDAWERYTESPWFDGGAVVLRVTEDDIKRSRKDEPDEWFNSTVEMDPLNGGGYMATLELFHQLHCLDMIRRYTYPDHYPRHSFKTVESFLRDHIADATLITFHWAEGLKVPMPDFHTWHQCRDPEEILRWAKEHEALITHPIIKTDGVVETPMRLWKGVALNTEHTGSEAHTHLP